MPSAKSGWRTGARMLGLSVLLGVSVLATDAATVAAERPAGTALAAAHGVSSAAEDLTKIVKKRCAKGRAANDYPSWKFIANNARRTADDYAVDHNPNATFVNADVAPVFQMTGTYAGGYLVRLVAEGPLGSSFAMLCPNFDFCADPADLDDSRPDLFSVVTAKFNGRPF